MLGLYEFKYFVGENEIMYHLSAQNTYIVSIIFFNISYEWDSTSTKA